MVAQVDQVYSDEVGASITPALTARTQLAESSGNIFLDLGFPPQEAEVMLLRATLAEVLRS